MVYGAIIAAVVTVVMGMLQARQAQKMAIAQARAQHQMLTMEAEQATAAAETTRRQAIEVLQDESVQTEETKRQKQSDAARAADRESAELVAFSAEISGLGTNSFLNQMQQLQYFGETDLSRIERDARLRQEDIENRKEQIVENQKQVYNQSSLQMYAANVNSKLSTSFAKQKAFLQIANTTAQAAIDYYDRTSALETSKNIDTSASSKSLSTNTSTISTSGGYRYPAIDHRKTPTGG